MHRNLRDLLRAEAAAVWELQKQGVIRDLWFTKADRRAIIMLECTSLEEAKQHVAGLPMVRAELIDFTLLELSCYDGIERLFAASPSATSAPAEEPAEY